MPDGRSSSAPTLSDSVSANKRDPPPSRPSLPPHVIPPPAAHPTAPLNTNYTVRTSYKTRTPCYSRRVNWRAYPRQSRRQRPWRTSADSSRRHANRKRAPRQTAWTTAAARTSSSRGAGGFKGDAAAMSASSTADRRRFTRGRAAAAAASMACSARIAWFRRIEAKRAPSRVATTIRITPSVRPVTDASAAAASTKKSCASWPHRVIRASGITAGASAPRRKEKPARDTPTTHASSAVLRIFALVQALRCRSA